MQWKDKISSYVVDHAASLVGGVFILIGGIIIARFVGNVLMGWLGRKEFQLEPPVKTLIVRIVRLLIVLIALVIAAGTLGVDVTAMVAGIGVAGVGIGLAMQGVLSNVVAGLTIIFTKPFRVGEYIEILGEEGQVVSIELFTTVLTHGDLSRVVIPNRKIVGEILHNYGTIRQLNLSVGVAYAADLGRAQAIVAEILKANPRVLKNLTPVLGISALADSSVNLSVKPWAAVPDFGPAQAEIYQTILERFRAEGIEIPFPQREVHLLKEA